MPEFVERDVRALEDSSSSEPAVLLVGTTGDRDELRDQIVDIGGEVLDSIGRTAFRVSVPKSEIDTLCEIDAIASVEFDKNDVYTQNQGNL